MDVKTYNTPRVDLTQELLDKSLWSDTEVTQLSTPSAPRPLKYRPEPEITNVAKRFVDEMMAQTDWKIIALRQAIVMVPVVKIEYEWKNVADTFYIYGAEKLVYFPHEYPGHCCGGCCCCGDSCCVVV